MTRAVKTPYARTQAMLETAERLCLICPEKGVNNFAPHWRHQPSQHSQRNYNRCRNVLLKLIWIFTGKMIRGVKIEIPYARNQHMLKNAERLICPEKE